MNDLFYENIDLYVYNECSEEEMSLFKEHIKSCDKCRAEFELALSVKDAMSSMPKITPPADFSRQINDRLVTELIKERKRRFKPEYRRYSAVAACLVLVTILGTDVARLINSTGVNENALPFDVGLQTQVPQAEAVNAQASVPPSSSETPAPTAASQVTPANSTAPLSQSDTVRDASANKIAPISTPAASQMTQRTQATENAVISQTQAPVYSHAPVTTATPVQTAAPEAPTPAVIVNDSHSQLDTEDIQASVSETVPDYMDPREHVVLASTVEKQYQTTGISIEDLPVKERDLEAEFALLENPRTGVIIANPATLSSLEGVEIAQIKDNRSKKYELGIGSGSILISAKDKDVVNEVLEKYVSGENDCYYYFTADNFEIFIDELKQSGVHFEEHFIPRKGDSIAFKLVVA